MKIRSHFSQCQILRFSLALVPLLIGWGCQQSPPPPKPVVPVTVAQAQAAEVPVEVRAVGSIEPLQSVAVRAQVGGILKQVNFQEGDDVTEGQVLFQIDPREYDAALNQAKANLERDRVLALNAESDAKRYGELVQKDYVTREQFEKARAAADSYKSILDAGAAAVESARLNLEYTTIRAPLSARTGSFQVKLGNLVKADDTTPLVIINQIHPILVKFAIPEQYLSDIRKFSAAKTLVVTAFPSRDGRVAVPGELVFIDNAVDSDTGTIILKGRFANAENALWPGQFVDTTVRLETIHNAVVVPSEAIQTGQQGTYVYVVDSTGVAGMRPVTAGRTSGETTVVEKGLILGETVVTDGQLRLVPGAKVEIKKSLDATSGQ